MTADEQNTTGDGEVHEHGKSVNSSKAKPTKRAKIMRGIVAPIFGLLAVAFFAFGLLNATVWKPTHTISAKGFPTSRYVVTDPGMLSLFDGNVTVKASKGAKSSGTVCLAIGQAKDVAGWLAGGKYDRVAGLRNWTNLHMEMAKGSSDNPSTKSGDGKDQKSAEKNANTDKGDAIAFKDSDMWSQVQCASSSRLPTVTAKASPSEVMIVDFGANAEHANKQVTMHWTRSKVPNTALPYYITAAVFVVCTVLSASILAMEPKRKKQPVKVSEDTASSEAAPGEVTLTEALTGSLQGLRRNLRSSGPGRHSKQAAQSDAADAAAAQEGLESARELRAQGPSIVDPSLHNLVQQADASTVDDGSGQQSFAAGGVGSIDASSDSDIELTSVVTDDDLQDYFARLSQEENVQESSASQSADDEVPQMRGDSNETGDSSEADDSIDDGDSGNGDDSSAVDDGAAEDATDSATSEPASDAALENGGTLETNEDSQTMDVAEDANSAVDAAVAAVNEASQNEEEA